MTETRTLHDEYFDWLCAKVKNRQYRSYKKLLRTLLNSPFEYILDRDANRYADGIDLRYHFAYETDREHIEVDAELYSYPCSMLEMMVALALRCEKFMSDPDYGNRAPVWFWSMIFSLGLREMTDANYDGRKVFDILRTFTNREYASNGYGGLFKLTNPPGDLRAVEIWYQAMWYFNEVI